MVEASEYAVRRASFLEAIGRGVALIPAAPVALRNGDVHHDYRQDSDLYYLTGFDEPESLLLLSSTHPDHRVVLFVRPRDPARETWDGAMAGVEGAVEAFGADAAFPIAELEQRLPDYLKDVERVHYRFGEQRDFDAVLFRAISKVRGQVRGGVLAPRELVDTRATLHGLRLRKSEAELVAMERAGDITREAHLRAMEMAVPGRYEYEVEAEIMRVFRARGAERPAYGSIVGSGPNATVLHHRRNDRQMQDGDLLLIDAGAELNYYASDVTRTFPVNGRFSDAQRALYDIVLEAQLAAIEAVKPGITFTGVHEVALQVLTRGLCDLGLIEGPVDEAIEKERYKPYYMHRTSHWLGMDVHDVGDYYVDKKSRPLEEGYVLTIEPGLYVAAGSECDPKWHGIGIRIEDDVAVTAQGHRVLTPNIPKEAAELEKLLSGRS